MNTPRTRLAPSPTGALHIGNLFSFILNWVVAKQNNWEIVLRIEDIDGPRKKIETIAEIIDTLHWVGINWDGDPRLQSEQVQPSRTLLQSLISKNLAYHCTLTRTELASALSAPHSNRPNGEPLYRPTDIPMHNQSAPTEDTNWRFICTQTEHTINDRLLGERTYKNNSDFVIWTKSNMPSYQLAVVADDHDQVISHVVRGRDLLQSTTWQEQLYNAMGWEIPQWHHHPLILGTDGKRLAKRHGDSRISTIRSRGILAERIIGLIAIWTNTQESLQPMTIEQFTRGFEIETLPQENIIFSKKEETWLFA